MFPSHDLVVDLEVQVLIVLELMVVEVQEVIVHLVMALVHYKEMH